MHARRKDNMKHEGLLAGSLGDGAQLHWLARLLGYVFVFVAFVEACANASLVTILSSVRLELFGLPVIGRSAQCRCISSVASNPGNPGASSFLRA